MAGEATAAAKRTEVRPVPQIKTVKRILCAVAVTNMYTEAVHARTAPSALTLPLVNVEQQTKCGTSVCVYRIYCLLVLSRLS